MIVYGGNGIDTTSGTMPYAYPGDNNAVGTVRWNSLVNNYQVWDGGSWHNVPTTMVDLSQELRELLAWVRDYRDKEQHMQELIKTNPALKDAYEKFLVTKSLCFEQDQS